MFLSCFDLYVLCCAVMLSYGDAVFEVPEVHIEVLSPKGFRVSIPDGISLFAFHGKLNEELENREAGHFSVDIAKAKKGRWTYSNKNTKLGINDVLYYWVNVDYDNGSGKRGYILDNQQFVVRELITDAPEPVSTTSATTAKTKATKGTKKPPHNNKHSTSTVSPCKRTQTLNNGKESCSGSLIFEENFEELSTQKWHREVRFADDPDYEFVIYENSPNNLYLSNSKLHIKPTLTESKYGKGFVSNQTGLNLGTACTAELESRECAQKPKAWSILPPAISAQVSTKHHFSFLYGIVEIRARFPKGDWLYPELILRSKNNDYGSGLESGLIRIAFAPGNVDKSHTLYGGCVLGYSLIGRTNEIQYREHLEKIWTEDFHIYRMEWRQGGITLSVDNSEFANISPPINGFVANATEYQLSEDTRYLWQEGSPLAPFDKEMYIVLGVGVGGQVFTDQSDGSEPWDNDDPKAQLHFYRSQDNWSRTWNNQSVLVVDYVKVWAL